MCARARASLSKRVFRYRDVRLNLRLETAATRRLGLDTHVCEVQLVLLDFALIKARQAVCAKCGVCSILFFSSRPLSFPPSPLPTFLPLFLPALPPSLPPSLPPFFPPSLTPSLPPSLSLPFSLSHLSLIISRSYSSHHSAPPPASHLLLSVFETYCPGDKHPHARAHACSGRTHKHIIARTQADHRRTRALRALEEPAVRVRRRQLQHQLRSRQHFMCVH